MNETVQIVFLGHWAHLDRTKFLLRKFIPHKVYFVQSKEALGFDKNVHDFRQDMKKELEKELPAWVRKNSEEVEIPFFNFEGIFPKMLDIMSKEKREGNEVIVCIHGASLLMGVAATMAAGLTGSKIYWIMPKKWSVVETESEDKIMKPIGATDMFEIKMPLLPSMPTVSEKAILEHILKNNGKISGKLSKLSIDIGLEHLGANLKKPSSGIVKLSKTISKLRDNELVITKRIGRKNFEITLTDKGKMMAEVSSILDSSLS